MCQKPSLCLLVQVQATKSMCETASRNTHLVPFRMPGILLPTRFRLLPEPPCCLCRRAEKLCGSEHCLPCSPSDRKDRLGAGLRVKLSLEAGSLRSQVCKVIASQPLQSSYIKWKPRQWFSTMQWHLNVILTLLCVVYYKAVLFHSIGDQIFGILFDACVPA